MNTITRDQFNSVAFPEHIADAIDPDETPFDELTYMFAEMHGPLRKLVEQYVRVHDDRVVAQLTK